MAAAATAGAMAGAAAMAAETEAAAGKAMVGARVALAGGLEAVGAMADSAAQEAAVEEGAADVGGLVASEVGALEVAVEEGSVGLWPRQTALLSALQLVSAAPTLTHALVFVHRAILSLSTTNTQRQKRRCVLDPPETRLSLTCG
mmetsp:Transcript_39827/g.94591  ORF Transcript_39827/g.94591 Transcript_39827/m.94591 type:complete len:145 (-) Transcript_39827:282-716(-)